MEIRSECHKDAPLFAGRFCRIPKLRLRLWLISILALLSGCSKEKTTDWEPYYAYFPTTAGHWVFYRVDSTAYNALQDTVIDYTYWVKETILDQFTDLEGLEWQRIDREIYTDTAQNPMQGEIVAQRRSKNTAERIENNLRFIKLSFPFRKFSYWQGNSYIHYDDPWNCNFWGEWEFKYQDLFFTGNIGVNSFDSLVRVMQVADSGLVCKNLWEEIYAPGIGMVYRHTERLTTQKSSPDPFYLKAENGFIVTYTLVDRKQ
ncbi:MAG TPA: hypothetical protein P5228_10475 [Bacteroidales bacterium]|nr:hypothetical protein [Bacteroidales bacterium]HRZ48284.1 hypothetical protein [Bacteroidales bacterium]